MNAPMPWVKLYIDMLDDTKLLRLSEACRWRFVQLVLMAGECDADGLLTTTTGPMSMDDIARRLRVRSNRLEEQMASLINVGLVEYTGAGYKVVKFAERQGRKQSEKREQWRKAQAKARKSDADRGPQYDEVVPNSGQTVPTARQIDTELTQFVPPLAENTPETPDKSQTVIHDTPLKRRVEKSREESSAAQKPPRTPKVDYFPLASELAAVCHQDLKANPRFFKDAETLSKADPPATPELVREHYNGRLDCFWRKHDWRGKKGDDPTPAAIRETWGKWRQTEKASLAAQYRAAGYTDANGNPV